MAFNHGVDIDVSAVGRQPVPFAGISTVGVIGTAPNADVAGAFANGGAIAYDEPFHLTSIQDAKDLGESGTLPAALRAIYAQGDVNVITLIVEPGTDGRCDPRKLHWQRSGFDGRICVPEG